MSGEKRRLHQNPNVSESIDVDRDEFDDSSMESNTENRRPKRKRLASQPLLIPGLNSIQRSHAEQALALQTETNCLLKKIIAQNNNAIDLLKSIANK